MIDEPEHPLTLKLNKVSKKSRAILRINIAKTRTKVYENSFVQKYLRTLRSGTSDLYTTRLHPEERLARVSPKTVDYIPDTKAVTKTTVCPHCNKNYKAGAGIKSHIRLAHKQ